MITLIKILKLYTKCETSGGILYLTWERDVFMRITLTNNKNEIDLIKILSYFLF